MALIKCPKCGKEFSDRAQACPQCGTSKEEVQRIIKEQKEKEYEQEHLRKEHDAEEARIRAEKRAEWWAANRKKIIVLVLTLFILFGGYVAYINITPVTAKNESELHNPLRFSIKVIIPSEETEIKRNAFYECTSLTSVTIPNSVTSIGGDAFSGCSGLTEFIVSTDNPNYSSEEGVLFNKTKSILIKCPCRKQGDYVIPNSVTSIENGAFRGCESITSIIIPNSVTSIGNDAFHSCKSLISIEIPNGVTSIGWGTFDECTSLTSVTIPNSVTSIGPFAFAYCYALTSLEIPQSVTNIDYQVFDRCHNLTLKIPQRFREKYKNSNDCKEVIYY